MNIRPIQLRRRWFLILVACIGLGCSTVPVTGRRSFNLVPDSQANALGLDAYKKVKQQSRLITRGSEYEQVVRVGKKIAAVADESSFDWEFALIDDAQVNAFCLPGGKIAVYRGLLPVTQDDAGLAVVLAHEIGHAIARHGSERMTDDLALQLGGAGLSQLLEGKSATTQTLVMSAFGVGTAVGFVLPFSRSQESEADHIGLVLMARAGYDPHVAPTFWTRMMAKSSGQQPPAFLSDHPSDQQRIRDLEKWMPEADVAYRRR